MTLKETIEKDRRGLNDTHNFVEDVAEGHAILSYYGQGDSHEGIFSYDETNGWKFVKYYDRWFENLSEEEKEKTFTDLLNGFKDLGFTEIEKNGSIISLKKRDSKSMDFSEDIDPDFLLSKYGPEGLYEIAKLLMKKADEDVSDALNGD